MDEHRVNIDGPWFLIFGSTLYVRARNELPTMLSEHYTMLSTKTDFTERKRVTHRTGGQKINIAYNEMTDMIQNVVDIVYTS